MNTNDIQTIVMLISDFDSWLSKRPCFDRSLNSFIAYLMVNNFLNQTNIDNKIILGGDTNE